MPAGRPSKWEDRFIALAWEYLDKHESFGDPVPTIEGLACECGVGKQAVYQWAQEHEEFSLALEALKATQGRKLQAGGLQAKFQPVITKLMLSANHGMAEKMDNENKNLNANVEFDSADKAIAAIESARKK